MAINRVTHPFRYYCPRCDRFEKRLDIWCARDHIGAEVCAVRTCPECSTLGSIEARYAELLAS